MTTRETLVKSRDTIHRNAEYLKEYAEAFSQTGNEQMYNALTCIAHDIKQSADDTLKAYDDDISAQVDNTMKQIGQTLSALISKD